MTSAKQYFLIPSELMGGQNEGEQSSTYSKWGERPTCGWVQL